MKVKFISSYNASEFEENINCFIKDKNIINISLGCDNILCALILYNEK